MDKKKQVKKITLGKILNWILGIVFIIIGLPALFKGFILGGVSLILASLILLPPANKFSKEKLNFELSKGLKITLVTILFIIYIINISTSSLNNSYDNQSSIQNNNTSLDINSSNNKITYKFGEKIIVGNFAYTFNNYNMDDYIGDEYFGEQADGIFLIIDVTIENIAKESKTIWDSYVTIIDDQERRFEHDSMAEIYLEDSFSFEQMQPGLPKRGKIIFDVPQNIKGFIEISSDNVWSNEVKYVSLA